MNILVLPDSHARPGVNPRRFRWLLKYLQDTTPDMLLCLGDLADMPSLSSYDGSSLTGSGKRKASFDGRTVAADIEAANVALRTLGEWKGKKVFLMGNHEAAGYYSFTVLAANVFTLLPLASSVFPSAAMALTMNS